MQDLLIPKMTVIGTGLIGGSLSLALKAADAVGEVTGVGRGLANLQQAVELGVIDRFSQDAEAAVANADVVFLATPVMTLPVMAARVLPRMKPGAILTDGGSVKEQIVAEIEPLVPAGVHFVPGHPIAGTERSGAAAAFASLYQDRRCILTPTENTDGAALDLVRRMWEAAGSEVVVMDVAKHDLILAAISHLPHMVAYALVNAVASDQRYGEDILKYSAGGFRDFTRIASSDPAMWRDIAQANREALLEMIGGFETMLAELKQDIVANNGDDLFAFFSRSKERRDALL